MMAQQFNNENKLKLVSSTHSTTHNVAVKQRDQVSARLPSLLQTTLDLSELLSLFQQQLQQVLKFDSYHYHHDDIAFAFDSSSQSHHSCHYALELNGHFLGDISLTRRKVFSETELQLFESLLSLVVYPLRNCLLYKKALDAAMEDSLTGLNNRAAFDNSLKREIELAYRQKSPLSILVLDIDHFKVINDTYGHASGDKALRQLADNIKHTMRGSDIAFRYGGEEFTLILNNTTQDDARIVANRLRVAASQLSCEDDKHTFGFTISVGIAQLKTGETASELFDRADKALYEAKKAGRNAAFCA